MDVDGDTYSLTVYDYKILYIPTVDLLENYMYNDNFAHEVDQKHSILKKMDIVLEYHIAREKSANGKKLNQLKVGFGAVEIRLTNKELQQLKDFQNNIVKYHDQINYEVERELEQIQKYI